MSSSNEKDRKKDIKRHDRKCIEGGVGLDEYVSWCNILISCCCCLLFVVGTCCTVGYQL